MSKTGPIGMPPFIKVGGILSFRSAQHLLEVLERDLSSDRLSAVDLTGLSLHEAVRLELRVEGFQRAQILPTFHQFVLDHLKFRYVCHFDDWMNL